MRLSHRIKSITGNGDDGWGVFLRARQMVRDGTDVTELTIGEHDRRTDPAILDEMHRSAQAGNTGYAPVPGSPDLRAAVAARTEMMTGVPTSADNVLITTGGQAALFAAHLAALDPGDNGVFCDPYYTTYPGVIRAVGGKDRALITRSRDAFQPQAEDLDQACQGARSLLINSPNNPTGVVYDTATMDRIAEATKRHDLILISDEVYDSQVWDGAFSSPRALPDMVDRTIVVGSMSKAYAMTGSRVGWVIAPEPAIALILDLLTVNTYGVPGFVQDAATFALAKGARFEAEVAQVFHRRRDLAREVLQGSALRLIPPSGAMYLMLDIRATGLSGEDFANRLLDEEHIAVMPGESFGTAAAGHVRVALTVEDTKLQDALRRLERFANNLART